MNKIGVLLAVGCALAVTTALAAERAMNNGVQLSAAGPMPPSRFFDKLSSEPDVVYLIANSSLVFGVDPHGRSEEITFIGPVTVPKWPMEGYARRILPDGRQQIDIELTQSELTGESYMLHGPVVLGEHPELRSLGTITERPSADNGARPVAVGSEAAAGTETGSAQREEAPADFVVERKVLMTTSKGIMYNETAVPVRGRVDSIPPIKFQSTPTGINVFRGMELPTPLLDKDGNVNGWFYSKSHMAYAVLPKAIERSFIKGTVELRSGDKTETVDVSGPAEIHHLTAPAGGQKTDIEVIMLALRGESRLLGGDIMFTETFGDRDHFSRGQLNWSGNDAKADLSLFVDLMTPSVKASTQQPLALVGEIANSNQVNGRLEKGKLNLPLVGGKGRIAITAPRVLYDEVERPVVEVIRMELNINDINGA